MRFMNVFNIFTVKFLENQKNNFLKKILRITYLRSGRKTRQRQCLARMEQRKRH